ncbi:MAG: von Willebrand factor type A domain-containing protein [Bacteroidota bacterium]
MKALFSLFAISLMAFFVPIDSTEYTLKGKVSDDNGDVLIGANVLVKGTSTGTVTDVDGTFEIKVSNRCEELEISYTGYESAAQKVCEGDFAKIRLATGTKLDEVVVIGVQKKPKMKNRTSSISTIRATDRMFALEAPPAASYMPMHDAGPAHNTEDYSHIQENRFHKVTDVPLSTFSIDVDAASYSNLRRFINNGQTPPADAVRIEEMVNYFDYDYPQPTGEHPFEVATEISTCPWNSDNHLLMIGMQGEKIATEHLPPSNLVFLIDVSGSMRSMNKLPLLKSSLKMLVNNMREEDRVAIAVYASATGLVLPPTPGSNRQKIIDALDRLEAGGSTAGAAGIKLAYETAREHFVEKGNNRVILATDGDFNVGVSSDGELVKMIEKERESGVFLTVLGFGTGNYKDNKMQELADHGNGNHYYIDNINEGRKVLVNEFGGTLFTIAKDVKIQIEFNPAFVQGYRLIGYENRLLNKEDFNDDKKDAGELGSGHRVTALYEIIPSGTDSEFLGAVDDLKYQKNKVIENASKSDEMLTIKLRYKQPDGDVSQKIEKPVSMQILSKNSTSDNFRFAAAVAEFGMLLRDSEFRKNASYKHAAQLAKGAMGKDENGYRRELVDMIETMGALQRKNPKLEAGR